MLTKHWRSQLGEKVKKQSSSWLQQSKNFFSFKVDKTEELKSLNAELQHLSPASQSTMQTLIQNSQLKREIKLPEQDFLLAQIAAYAYLVPEERPYQI
ncbi:MAG: hypothetical protein Q4B28_01605 [bacterium]|nr:hypothetical protein [bacterium]